MPTWEGKRYVITRYVEQVVDELMKNHQGSKEDDAAYGGCMYEIPVILGFVFIYTQIFSIKYVHITDYFYWLLFII